MKPALSLLAIIPLLLGVSGPVRADEQEQARERLQAVQEKIQTVQEKLEADRGKQGKLEAGLRRVERRLGRTARELRRIKKELGKRETRLKNLHATRADQLQALARQQDALARQVRAAYASGRQERIKLLLNQEDPASVGRSLAYYEYFNRARLERIAAVEASLTDLRRTEAEIADETRALEQDRKTRQAQKKKLEGDRKQRSTVLASLAEEIRRADRNLQTLREDEQQMQELIASLNRALADIPAEPGADEPFDKLKGRLPWPLTGTFKAHYGERRKAGGGKARWRGVLINAPQGRKIRAISHGRVAFADWMRGFGLLVIVDHGDGYMSLYGHNQSLYQSTGAWVEAGDVIGAAGDSGGQAQAGLYFEIRHNGKPVNPASWCSADAKLATNRSGGGN